MSADRITKNILIRTYAEAGIPNADDEHHQYGIHASHPDYPELSAKSAAFKNAQRNTDLAIIRLLSNIAEQERQRANNLSDAYGTLLETHLTKQTLTPAEPNTINTTRKTRGES